VATYLLEIPVRSRAIDWRGRDLAVARGLAPWPTRRRATERSIGLGESGDQRERNGEPWLATALAMAVADVGECDSCAEPESASELMDRCGLCAM